jgi:hypothetical protein
MIYSQDVILKFEYFLGKDFNPIKTPFSEGYHPEVDDSPQYTGDDSAKCRPAIVYCIWIIVLGRIDKASATSTMSISICYVEKDFLK